MTKDQRPTQGLRPARFSAIIKLYLPFKCAATAPIRICPHAGCTASCARAAIWQYCRRKPAPTSSEATNLRAATFRSDLRLEFVYPDSHVLCLKINHRSQTKD
jgi:hypothetical protein